MKSEFLDEAGPHLLVSYPNGRQFGHLGLELVMSLAEARARRAALYIVRPRRAVNAALLEIESEEVALAPPRMARDLWFWSRFTARRAGAWCAGTLDRSGELVRDEIGRELARRILDPSVPPNLRDRLKGLKSGLGADRDPPAPGRPYFRRRAVRDPVRVALRPPALAEAQRAAARVGMPLDGPLVAVHAREAGFKAGMEVQEKHRRLGKRLLRDDSVRNARIETYFLAVDRLVSRGYTIVRLGDPSMLPVERRGVVDLARDPGTAALQVLALLSSQFLIAGESGPVGVSYLTNTPVVNVNVTDPIGSYPVRATGVYLPKQVRERESGRELAPMELLDVAHLTHLRDTTRYCYIDNTPEQIAAAVDEMLDGLQRGWRDTPAQTAFRTQATVAADVLRPALAYVRKWGADEGFLGDGRLARVAADRVV